MPGLNTDPADPHVEEIEAPPWAADGNSVVAEREAVRVWRAELVDGLRWLRVNSDEASPWYEPASRPRYGVLAHWGFGHLIEYHARRPSIATNFGSFVGEDGFRDAAQAMLETDPMDFREACVRLGVRYVVVTPRHAGDLKSLARIAGREGGGWFRGSQPRALRTALYRLALPPQGAPDDHYPGFERVYQSPQRESTHGGRAKRGELAGPVISIYRLSVGEGEAAARPR